jgi:hypothetical protein
MLKRLGLALLLTGVAAASPAIDLSRQRNLRSWEPQIAAYSLRHYGHREWRLNPKCIVLHNTAERGFPENLASSTSFAGESPGLASHFVVDGTHVWQLLPPTVRCRGTYGINQAGISIEMVADNASDLSGRRQTLETTAELVVSLLERFHLRAQDVYSHQQVATMDRSIVPWVEDRENSAPYHKIDPGIGPMRTILRRVRELQR